MIKICAYYPVYFVWTGLGKDSQHRHRMKYKILNLVEQTQLLEKISPYQLVHYLIIALDIFKPLIKTKESKIT